MNTLLFCIGTVPRKRITSIAYSFKHHLTSNMMHKSNNNNTECSPSHQSRLIERIRALDRSAELSQRYTPLVLFHPTTTGNQSDKSPASVDHRSSSYVTVGHVETKLLPTLLECNNEDDKSVFVMKRIPNRHGTSTDALILNHDHGDWRIDNTTQLFQHRTLAFEHVTDHLISSGVISRKHADLYPIYSFDEKQHNSCNKDSDVSGGDEKEVLAHINRNTAPHLGMDSLGVHLHCYVCERDSDEKKPFIKGVWLAQRAANKSHHPGFWDPTVAGGQPVNLSILDNIIKEAYEEAGVPAEWCDASNNSQDTNFTDNTHDPLTITTAKSDGSCMKRSIYYSCDLQVPYDWTPTPIDGEVAQFKLYSMKELEEELRLGNSLRPAMRAVLVDFMIRHGTLEGEEGENIEELRDAMRRERLNLL